MKDCLARKEVEKYKWVDTKEMLADPLTKESANAEKLMNVLESGNLGTTMVEDGGED